MKLKLRFEENNKVCRKIWKMDFSWALERLKDGEYVRRSSWNNGAYHYKLKDGKIIDNLETNIGLNNADLLAEDWNLFQSILKNGTLVQSKDWTTGIVLDFDDYKKEYTILTENNCVECFRENEILTVNTLSGIKEDLQIHYNNIIRMLRNASKDLENK